jgi:hypothetical protein
MNTHRRVGRTLVLALTLVGTGIAHAEDFALTVPVHLSYLMPPIQSGRIECLTASGSALNPQNMIGQGFIPFTIDSSTGRFDQNVVVRFNAESGKNPATATHYFCRFILSFTQANGIPRSFVYGWGSPATPETTGPFATKPGAPFVPWVTGPLP